MRRLLDETLEEAKKKLIRLSSCVEETINDTITALINNDLAEAKKVIKNDFIIDEQQLELEDFCVQVIATKQPIASDLRFILSYIKTAGALEKIGDYAKNICKRIELTPQQYIQLYQSKIEQLQNIIYKMVRDTVDALITGDIEKAKMTAQMDNLIDAIHKSVYREIVSKVQEDRILMESSIAIISVVHTLERIGDMITTINEHTVYACSGTHVDLNT